MASPTRVLFLEMDAGDKFLIQQWAADGTMPTWGRLLADGLVADTMSVEGFFVGSTWPSLYTGVNPARHGFHSLMQLKPGTYDFKFQLPGQAVRHEPFWAHLSRVGQRVAILDVPLSSVTPGINGIQTVEWGSHDHVYGFHTEPKDLAATIQNRFGLHPLKEICNEYGRTPADFMQLRDDLIEGVRRKREITRHFLTEGNWDFFCQVFTESHCVGHQCWHIHDPDHPAYDPTLADQIGDPIRDVYHEIDAAFGEILDEVGEDTLVVVLAGHRMAHKFGAQFLLPDILVKLGVAAPAVLPKNPASKRILDSSLTWMWQRTPELLKRPLQGLRVQTRDWVTEAKPNMAPHLAALDLVNSQCFVMDNGFPVSGLRLNLEDREPAGMLAPGAEADAFCSRLAHDLLELVNAESGRPMVKAVKRTNKLYQGPYLDYLPDLLVEWADDDILGSASCGNPVGSRLTVKSEKIGELTGTNTYPRTGDHRPQGLLAATGPGIAPGRLNRTVSLMDLAPTFSAALGLELPDVDGKVITELISPDS